MSRSVSLYVVLACVISWLLWSPLWLPKLGVAMFEPWRYQHALGALGPITAAFIMRALEDGSAGVSDLLRRMVKLRGAWLWILIALLSPYLLYVIAQMISGKGVDFTGLGTTAEYPEFGAVAFLLYNVISFGYGEEVGWRGYLLPKLQERFRPLVASLIVTPIWALWHLPLFLYRPGYTSMDAGGAIGWVVSLLTGSILLTWMYNGSRGSLLVVAIFHATIDIAFTSRGATPEVVQMLGMLVTVWGVCVAVWMWRQKRAPRNSPLNKEAITTT